MKGGKTQLLEQSAVAETSCGYAVMHEQARTSSGAAVLNLRQ